MESATDLTGPMTGVLDAGSPIGTELTVRSVLGRGGTGIVYCADHAVLGRQVAVKMSLLGGGTSGESWERLVREAQMAASVRDPHVPRIYALEKLPDGTPYIVMEKVEGTTLSQLISAGPLPAHVACELGHELLLALEAVHRRGIVHRDIKPGNLMICLDDDEVRLRLLDFGVGKVLRSEELKHPAMTHRGSVIGTPLYMAPEQLRGEPVDECSDLYAAGVVLYEMLAGRPPFQGSVVEVIASVLRDEIPPLSVAAAHVPLELAAVVEQALQKRRNDRFKTARAMREALREVLKKLKPSPVSPAQLVAEALAAPAPDALAASLDAAPTWSVARLRQCVLRPRASERPKPSAIVRMELGNARTLRNTRLGFRMRA